MARGAFPCEPCGHACRSANPSARRESARISAWNRSKHAPFVRLAWLWAWERQSHRDCETASLMSSIGLRDGGESVPVFPRIATDTTAKQSCRVWARSETECTGAFLPTFARARTFERPDGGARVDDTRAR